MLNNHTMKTKLFGIALMLALLASGCADKVPLETAAAHAKVGFWYGWWHGSIAGFAWIVSLFSDNVSMYAVYNSGGWYDFGFLLGIGTFAGGCSCSGKRK